MQKEVTILMKDNLTNSNDDIDSEKWPIRTLRYENFKLYKQDILELEQKVFKPKLCDNEEGLRDALKINSALCFSIYDNNKMIGIYYLTLLDDLDINFFDKYLLSCWNPTTYLDYKNNNTYYIHIVAVDPDYQGHGIGKKLHNYT